MSQRYIGGVVTETTNVAQNPWTGEWTQQAALQGFAGAQAPTRIANSLRLRSSASACLSRTPSVAGNQQKFSLNLWVKRGALGTYQTIFYAGANSTFWFALRFNTSDKLDVIATAASGATAIDLNTNAVFRDPSAWYSVNLVVDTTNATAANRVLIYVNGVSQSLSITTSPTQNQALSVNGAVIHTLGVLNYVPVAYFDGYLAEVNFVDGQALPPTAFGQFNKTSGVWQAMPYTGTYGLNGFKLNFSNGTSTTTLGYDSSGNGNNWTTNNISLTAGSTYDWMIDSPVNSPGSSYGVGNYCVLNAASIGTDCTLSDGNLGVAYGSATTRYCTMGTIGMSSGKWYAEFSYTGGATPYPIIGVSSKASATDMLYYVGYNSYGWGYESGSGNKYNNGSGTSYGATWTTGDIIGIAFDADAGTLTFYKNNTSQGTAFTGLTSGPYYFGVSDGGGTSTFTGWINFGQRPFTYTPPSGYKSLCTQNLPVATIYNGANFMAATLWTGNSSSQTVTNSVNGVGFQPDFVWIKDRSTASAHALYDSVRGNTKVLSSNATTADYTQSPTAGLNAFNSNGFSVTYPNTGDYYVNVSGDTYVGWQWKAGGTAVTNTAGSISSQVSANTTAGFSVVTYTGTGANATVGHGLGVAPSMIIVKNRSVVENWPVYHASLTANGRILLNTTGAYAASSAQWNNTAPTSSVFTVNTDTGVNGSGNSLVAYCFAAISGYSAFGSYTGNGSSDGPFVYCGFRPRYFMTKCTSSTSDWIVMDTSRDTYNVSGLCLEPNLNVAESTNGGAYSSPADILSNGFKIRNSGAGANGSGATYIYAAFAENPFQIALAR